MTSLNLSKFAVIVLNIALHMREDRDEEHQENFNYKPNALGGRAGSMLSGKSEISTQSLPSELRRKILCGCEEIQGGKSVIHKRA